VHRLTTPAARSAVFLCLFLAAQTDAAVWRGSLEVGYQTQPEDVGPRLHFWREYLQVSVEDRLLVGNNLRLSLRLENRSFGNRQPSQFRPRLDLEMGGLGYAFRFFYAPFTLKLVGAPEQRERRYSAGLAVFPHRWPRLTLSWDGQRRVIGEVEDSRYNNYLVSAEYTYGIWLGQGRLLRQNRMFGAGSGEENVTVSSLRNDLTVQRRFWGFSLGHQLEYTDRRLTTGLNRNSTVNDVRAWVTATPHRKVRFAADFDGRFTEAKDGGSDQSTDNQRASARLNYSPFRFLEAGALRYYTRSSGVADSASTFDYTQVRVAANGPFYRTLSGLLSFYRTWNHVARNTGDVNDAVYLRLFGEFYPRTDLSLEFSYFDRHFGPRPIAVVRALTFRMRPFRRSDWQVQYASQGSSRTFDLRPVERQNVNLIFQQGLSNRSQVSVGTSFNQDTRIVKGWQQTWLLSGSVGIRQWALLSLIYNRIPEIRIIPGMPEAEVVPTQTTFQFTLYPERGWVANLNYFDRRLADGRRNRIWGAEIRYQF
jgi:hypothetical protein